MPPVSLCTERLTTNIRMSSRSQRSAIAMQRVAKIGAIGHLVDHQPELAADRVGHFGGQQVERGGDRMTGAKPAHEDVERDRKLVLQSCVAARLARS